MLAICEYSPYYNQKIFDKPLQECKFTNLNLNNYDNNFLENL